MSSVSIGSGKFYECNITKKNQKFITKVWANYKYFYHRYWGEKECILEYFFISKNIVKFRFSFLIKEKSRVFTKNDTILMYNEKIWKSLCALGLIAVPQIGVYAQKTSDKENRTVGCRTNKKHNSSYDK